MNASCAKVVESPSEQSHCSVACAQVRHGAALALREVLRSQAAAAAVLAPLAAEPTGVPRASAARLVDEMGLIHRRLSRIGELHVLQTPC